MKKLIYLGLSTALLFLTGCDDDEPHTPTIDLAAQSIEFTIDKTTDFEGVAFIRGTVKNVGADYVSGANQQVVYLYEQYPGGQKTQVAKKAFTTLEAGGILEVKYARTWRTSVEFPPKYILSIAYGPDIYIDGKQTNDDKNSNNNSLERNGADINELF